MSSYESVGLIVANTVDSNKTLYLAEAISYLSINAAGVLLCIISTFLYTTNTNYGEEESVIIPRHFSIYKELYQRC